MKTRWKNLNNCWLKRDMISLRDVLIPIFFFFFLLLFLCLRADELISDVNQVGYVVEQKWKENIVWYQKVSLTHMWSWLEDIFLVGKFYDDSNKKYWGEKRSHWILSFNNEFATGHHANGNKIINWRGGENAKKKTTNENNVKHIFPFDERFFSNERTRRFVAARVRFYRNYCCSLRLTLIKLQFTIFHHWQRTWWRQSSEVNSEHSSGLAS